MSFYLGKFKYQKKYWDFCDDASHHYHGYFHHHEFKTAVVNDTNSFTRPTIGKELDARIEKRNDSLAGIIKLKKKNNNNNHGRSEKEVWIYSQKPAFD